MNGTLQLAGFGLSCIAAILTFVAVFLPEWRRNDPKVEIIESVVRHQGIWLRCTAYATGQWQCDDFDAFFLGLPVQLQTARGLAVFSLVAGFFGLLLSIVGLECTKCVDDNQKTKSRIALIASACWILSAFTIGVAVSYYANQVVQDYQILNFGGQSANETGQRYVFGASLFLGWGAMALGMLGGLVMMCGSFYVESEDDDYWRNNKVGRGVRRMRESFRESFRPVRTNKDRNVDYV